MSLTNAECVSEAVRDDGRLYTQITLTGALSGLSQDSLMQKGLSKLSKARPRTNPSQTRGIWPEGGRGRDGWVRFACRQGWRSSLPPFYP